MRLFLRCSPRIQWLIYRGQNNGWSMDMTCQNPLNVHPELLFFEEWCSHFSHSSNWKRVCLIYLIRVTKCKSDIDKSLYSHIPSTITFTWYSNHYFMFMSNFTNHEYAEWHCTFLLQSDSTNYTLNSYCLVDICI